MFWNMRVTCHTLYFALVAVESRKWENKRLASGRYGIKSGFIQNEESFPYSFQMSQGHPWSGRFYDMLRYSSKCEQFYEKLRSYHQYPL